MTDISWLSVMIVLGLLAGSVLNCIVWRLPLMIKRDAQVQPCALPDNLPQRFNLFVPRSCCPHCRAAIAGYHNIPLISWLWLRGRCYSCRERIGWRYPLLELAAGLSAGWVALCWPPGPAALALALCSWLLLALAAIDIGHFLLPDVLTLPLLWLGLLVNLNGELVPLADAVCGAVAGYLTLWSLYWGYRLLTGKEGLGYGDFKLLAALGAWCGWQALAQIVLGAALLGIAAALALRLTGRASSGSALPFGPCLALAGWGTMVMQTVAW